MSDYGELKQRLYHHHRESIVDQEKTSDPRDRERRDTGPRPGFQGEEVMARAIRPISDAEIIEELFKHHAPTYEQGQRMEILRGVTKTLAALIIHTVPPCADRTAAIRKLGECLMTANRAVATGGVSL